MLPFLLAGVFYIIKTIVSRRKATILYKENGWMRERGNVWKGEKGLRREWKGHEAVKDYRIRDDGSLIEWFSNSLSPIVYSP